MRRIAPNLFCLAGWASMTYAMWQVHPALMWGGTGVLLTAAGVFLYRVQNAPIKGQAK